MKDIYLDHASTTKLDGKVLEKMLPYLSGSYGNANSVHKLGRDAVKGLDEAREIVSGLLNCSFNEVYFTSGGTEGDNWALHGFTKARGNKSKIVISSIEHSAMLSTVNSLKGVEVITVRPDAVGIVEATNYKNLVDENTYLATLMLANNEVGTMQPVKQSAEYAHEKGAYFFTDAVQAMGAIKIDVKDLGVDMLSFSAHKFNGPKGVGAVYIKNGTKIDACILGGHQERGLRGGTSNVAGAIGLAYSLKFTRENLEKDAIYITSLRNYFIEKLLSLNSSFKLNGDKFNRLPNNANILFSGINGEALLYKMDMLGVYASLGAACSAGSIEPSKVLTEMGLSEKEAKSSVRFTFGRENTFEEVDKTIMVIKKAIKSL
ncbi:MAG: cysteine desulfurase [Clostridia bacterium]|nr:cysteine desulfurase [Clostridia bacterium]